MTKRLLQIIPSLVRGGAEKQLTLLASGLPRDEFDVHVAVLTRDGPYHEDLRRKQIPVSLIDKTWKIDPSAYGRLRRLVRELRPDAVHTWIFAANCYGRQAAIAGKVAHIVASERCVDLWKAWHQFTLDRYYARRTQRIVVNSTGVQQFYEQQGIPPDKFVCIANGIEPLPRQQEWTREQLLAECNLPGEARLIGAVGRLWPQKRYKDLIWSTELLRAGRGDVHLLIIGDGPQRESLERYARQVINGNHVHFLGQRDDVARFLPHLDCFWLASGYEGQSNGLMEAMSAGLPVVASDIPGNRDLVLPGQTGFLVSVGDCAEFSRKTHQLLNDPQLAQQLGRSGQLHMRDEFSVSKMVARYAEFYRELVL